jgi:hypothetical protein
MTIQGVFLETLKFGRRVHTTPNAISRFLAAIRDSIQAGELARPSKPRNKEELAAWAGK